MKKTIIVAFFGLSNFVFAQQKALPFDPLVRTGKLANGFTYFIRHNEEPKNRVTLYLVNKVGSVLESDDQQGLAHFMEHMSFNGTKHFPKNELVDYLQKSGVRFGADLNAYTSFDQTVYQLPLPTDKPAILANGLQIMRDWAQDALLDPTEINKERGVVLEEKRLGKGAQERMQRQYWPMMLNHSRYADRLPIGIDTVLNNFKPEAIKRFYHDWYRPDLQALIVVGDINVDSMERVIKTRFADLRNPKTEKIRTKYTVPLTGNNQFMSVTDPEQTQTVLEVMIKQPELKLHTAADYRLNIIRGLYNQMLGERFAELTRQADPPFIDGGGGMGGFMGGLDIFDASVVAKPNELERGFKAVWREAIRAKQFGFTLTELQRAEANQLSGIAAALKEKNKTNSDSYVNEYVSYFLKGTAAPGIDYEYQLTKADLSGITLADINLLAKTAIKTTDRDILVMAPQKDKASLPDEATVNGWINAVQAEPITAYQDNVSSLPLLTTQPSGGKIIAETKDTALGTTTLTLSNGVKVILKPTTFKDDEIKFTGFSRGGTSLYSDADFQSASNAIMIPSFGIGNYDPTQLGKFLTGKQVGVAPYIGDRTQGINGSAEPKDLETALQLVYAYYTEPRKDTALFKSEIERSKDGLLNRPNDPQSVYQDSVAAILGNHNVRRTGPSIQKVNQIDLDKAYTIYKERFADASKLQFTFVGSFDPQKIKGLVAQYLGALPATHKNEQAKDLGIHIPEGTIAQNVYKGSEPRSTVELFWSGKAPYSQKNNIQFDAIKECLEIRLLERLREEESGVYSPGAFVQAVKNPQSRYTFIVYFGCGPQNVDKLIASAKDEIEKLKASGPPQVNIDKWRAETLRSRETAIKTNPFWLNYLNGQLLNEDDLHELDSWNSDVQAVTQESIKAAANKYLSGDNYIRVVLLPEQKTQ
jgi:zinc protease